MLPCIPFLAQTTPPGRYNSHQTALSVSAVSSEVTAEVPFQYFCRCVSASYFTYKHVSTGSIVGLANLISYPHWHSSALLSLLERVSSTSGTERKKSVLERFMSSITKLHPTDADTTHQTSHEILRNWSQKLRFAVSY